jgi:hypothetical protein
LARLPLFFLYQCTQPIANPITEPEKKLVISSFFTADEQLTVWVGYPHDILTDTLLFEANATVELFENEQFIENINYISDGHYQSNYILKTGQKYRIEVRTNELSASAEDVIPAKILADSAYFELITLSDGVSIWNFRFQFIDPLNSLNYYDFLLVENFNYNPNTDSSIINFISFTKNIDPVLKNEDDYTFQPFSFFFSDELINGSKYQMNMGMESGGINTLKHKIKGKLMGDDSKKYLVFRTISKTYYDFQKSWVKHRYNQNLGNRLDNEVQLLFGGEVQPLKTNIKNGYGIFVAYQEQIIPFEE